MKSEIAGNPEFGHVNVELTPGDTLLVESGAMAHMSEHLNLKSRLVGGFFSALFRKVFGGESLLMGEYTTEKPGKISVSPSLPGEVRHVHFDGSQELFLQKGSFLAGTPGLELKTAFGGMKAFFSGEGAFFLKFSGKGELYFNAYGAIVEHDVNGTFKVDTGHVVGWESTLNWNIRSMGGLKSTLFSGEGLVVEYEGRGKVWTQTRSQGGLIHWLTGFCR